MKTLKQIYNIISDIFELYVPCISFVVVFVTYVIMIVYRYIFNAQINWIYELSMIAFVWTVVLSASYCSRKDDHIIFTMLYDILGKNGQLIFRIVGDLFIVVIMSILFPKAVEAVSFLAIKKSPLLKIPFSIIYSPFIVFNFFTIVHHLIELFKSIFMLIGCKKEDC